MNVPQRRKALFPTLPGTHSDSASGIPALPDPVCFPSQKGRGLPRSATIRVVANPAPPALPCFSL